MIKMYHEVNWFQRLVQRFAWTPVGVWVGSNFLHHLDRLVIRLSKGRISLSTIIAGVPIVMLTTTGAKSGIQRTVPLLGLPDAEKLILIASSWGRHKHPGWYYNLRKRPEAIVSTSTGQSVYRAHLAEGDEAERYWTKAVQLYPGYAAYRKRAKHRKIGLFILEPKEPVR